MMKHCPRCGKDKKESDFPLDKRHVSQQVRRKICAECIRADHNGADKERKIGVPWDEDPEILFRLDSVAAMMLEGAKPYQIKATMNYGWDTAKRDMLRVRELWRRHTGQSIADLRAASIAQYQYIQLRAWNLMRAASTGVREQINLMRQIADAQRQIDLIEGNQKPREINIGIELSEAARRALEVIDARGEKDLLLSEFEQYLIEAAEQSKE